LATAGEENDHIILRLCYNSYLSHLSRFVQVIRISDAKSSRPKWPRGQNIGLGPKDLASASKHCPRPQTFGLGLASISLSYYVIGHFLGKNRVKFGNSVNFSGTNLKSYVVNHYLVPFS